MAEVMFILIPKGLRRAFCLFLKFGQAILVRGLLLNFWNLFVLINLFIMNMRI